MRASPQFGHEEKKLEPVRILFVDDEELLLKGIEHFLRHRSDLRLFFATSPRLALDLLGEEEIDLLVSDFQMPEMDGVDLLVRAQQIQAELVPVLMTAYADVDATLRAINEAKVARLLHKPVPFEHLEAILEGIVQDIRLRRQQQRLQRAVAERDRSLRDKRQQLDQLVRERTGVLLAGLLSAIGYREIETHWHVRRVTLYTAALAAELGLAPAVRADLEWGALLHDVGKLSVPDSVINKPGPLDAREWELMRRHPRMGYELIEAISFLDPARVLILQHHENFDGSGYPLGLAGDEIALGARIFRVADSLDAMTSWRPYREALTFDEAYDELQRHVGSRYDPQVLEAFDNIPYEDWALAVELGQEMERANLNPVDALDAFAETVFGQVLEEMGTEIWHSDLFESPRS